MPDHLLLPQPDQRRKTSPVGSLLVIKDPRVALPSFWLRASANRERPQQIPTNGDGLVGPLDEGGRVPKDIRRYDLPLDGIAAISAELMGFGVWIDEYL